MKLSDRISLKCFRWVHQHELVYNTCWEDPRLDREALNLGPDDNVLVITSAGCNALDYALEDPNHVYAVDVNPLQNALLELKQAGIRTLDYEPFFNLFGRGKNDNWDTIYSQQLRSQISPKSQQVWDRFGKLFTGRGKRNSFYFRGSSGFFAWLVNSHINRSKVRDIIEQLLSCQNVSDQQELVDSTRIYDVIWKPYVEWALRRDSTMSMLGVPRCQRLQIETQYPGGILQFIKDRVDDVFAKRPINDNYFWRVYLTGEYTPECCPEYLRPENFEKLKNGLVDRISTHTTTVADFLKHHDGSISRFILLDHMDWLYNHYPEALAEEWQAITDRAADQTRILWRSAGLSVDFVDPINVRRGTKTTAVGDMLNYQTDLASRLHAQDRVNTYGSFYIADMTAA